MSSLNSRLLFGAGLTLLAFLGLTGLSLEHGFRESAQAAVQERLQAQVYMLLSSADVDPNGALLLPEVLPEARLATPLSGLYAGVSNDQGERLWESHSLLGLVSPAPPKPNLPGDSHFEALQDGDYIQLFRLSFSVDWETQPDNFQRFTFWVAEDPSAYNAQVEMYRRSLWSWLAGSAFLLLLVQSTVLRWSLRPLRQAGRQLEEIKTGQRSELAGPYPRELAQLAESLNRLLQQRQQRLERYRNTLADLAHSLKTPLAVLRGAVSQEQSELADTVREQVERMNRTVDYQLQRAAASGKETLAKPLDVEPLAQRMMSALRKVYRDKGVQIDLQLSPELQFRGDEGDLMEILGNLADNACKWCKQQVHIHARQEGNLWRLSVEDDGPGIAPEQRSRILERGQRADPATAGHGIGMAVVRDLVEEAYGGCLEIGQSHLGGALIRVALPGVG